MACFKPGRGVLSRYQPRKVSVNTHSLLSESPSYAVSALSSLPWPLHPQFPILGLAEELPDCLLPHPASEEKRFIGGSRSSFSRTSARQESASLGRPSRETPPRDMNSSAISCPFEVGRRPAQPPDKCWTPEQHAAGGRRPMPLALQLILSEDATSWDLPGPFAA